MHIYLKFYAGGNWKAYSYIVSKASNSPLFFSLPLFVGGGVDTCVLLPKMLIWEDVLSDLLKESRIDLNEVANIGVVIVDERPTTSSSLSVRTNNEPPLAAPL